MPEGIVGILPLILLFGIFYLLLIRPQQQQQKKRKEMFSRMKKGDRIVTVGGIYGIIKEMKDDTIVVRIADNVNVKMDKTSIGRIVDE